MYVSMHAFASSQVSKRVFGHIPKCAYMNIHNSKCKYMFKRICVHYAHLHFWSIISVISCALQCNLYHFFVFINWILGSKSSINYSPWVPIPFKLSLHLINIKGTYMQPMFSLSLIGKSFMCYLSLSLSLIVPHIQLSLALWSYVVNY